MKLSHSKLSQLLTCPMSYHLNYDVGLWSKQEKPALAVGSAVHWGIEHNTDDLTEYYNEHGNARTRDNYTREQLLAESMVYGYLKNKDELFKKLLTDPLDGSTLQLIDEQHEVYLTGKLKSNVIDAGHDFVGIVDLLLLTDKGFIVIDYKTSSYVPDWNNYLEQIYRYIFLLKQNFPDVPIVKIGIINLRKTNIRQKKNENWQQFLQRLRLEYEINDADYVNYHEYLPTEYVGSVIDEYILNLSKMADCGQSIVERKLWYINYGAANGTYGKSDYWDIFYKTPDAHVLYCIRDHVWSEEEQKFLDCRDCVPIDMKIIDDEDRLMNKYDKFKAEVGDHYIDTDTITRIKEKYITDENLLQTYLETWTHERMIQ